LQSLGKGLLDNGEQQDAISLSKEHTDYLEKTSLIIDLSNMEGTRRMDDGKQSSLIVDLKYESLDRGQADHGE